MKGKRFFKLSNYIRERWMIAIRKGNVGQIISDRDKCFMVLKNPASGWIADPFLFEWNGEVYIFGEYWDYKLERGTIAYTKIRPDLRIEKWKEIIVEPFHLSFPFIYSYGSEIYIIPESCKGNQISRYKCIDFPNVWRKETLISNVRCVDTTLYETDGAMERGYTMECVNGGMGVLFTIKDGALSIDSKCVLPKRTQRSAGMWLHLNDGLYRVAQDCDGSYGKGLVFMRQEGNDIKLGSEKETVVIYPEDIKLNKKIRFSGVHTYNSGGGYEVIDISCPTAFNIQYWFWKLINRIKEKKKKKCS